MIYVLAKVFLSIVVLFLHPYNLKGSENIPESGRAILVSNHQSNWDPILIALLTYRQVHFLGKAELFKNKFLTWFFRKQAGVIPVDRKEVKPRTIIDSMKILKEEGILGIFPEGTRVRDGKRIKVMDGFVLFAVRTKSPIIPIHISGSIKPWHKLNITVGEPIVLKEEFGKKVKDIDISEIASDIMDKIYELN